MQGKNNMYIFMIDVWCMLSISGGSMCLLWNVITPTFDLEMAPDYHGYFVSFQQC